MPLTVVVPVIDCNNFSNTTDRILGDAHITHIDTTAAVHRKLGKYKGLNGIIDFATVSVKVATVHNSSEIVLLIILTKRNIT